MTREQLEHVLRAAASIAGVTDLVVIGSQSILGTYPEWELPREATMSVEADIAGRSGRTRSGLSGKFYDIFEGTEQIQELVIARAISGLRIE